MSEQRESISWAGDKILIKGVKHQPKNEPSELANPACYLRIEAHGTKHQMKYVLQNILAHIDDCESEGVKLPWWSKASGAGLNYNFRMEADNDQADARQTGTSND